MSKSKHTPNMVQPELYHLATKEHEAVFNALLAACETTLEALECCGYGGSNIRLERQHEKMLKAAISKAKGKGE